MGKLFERVSTIWMNLEESYEKMAKVGETKKDFLIRLCGGDGSQLTPLIVSLEKEIASDDSVIEEGRRLSELLVGVQSNWKTIEAIPEISNLSIFVANLLGQYINSKNVQEFDINSLDHSLRGSIHLDSLEMLVRFKSSTTYVEASPEGTQSVKVVPVEFQSAIMSTGINSLLWIKDLISRVGVTDYLKQVHNMTFLHFEDPNAQPIIFLPKNLYRKTPSGCNVVVDGSTVRFPVTDYMEYEGEACPYTEYHGVLVVHTKYDYEPIH